MCPLSSAIARLILRLDERRRLREWRKAAKFS
jgi:hypothetical protein